jgi:mannose-6-phosphate isomerase-like protein (cupin superfamily)
LKLRQRLLERISVPATAGEATMIGYVANIGDITEENTDFRRVLYSGSKLQLVVMSVAPGEELGGETHENTD